MRPDHDLADLRRGLRDLADDAPPFDPRGVLDEARSGGQGGAGRARMSRVAPWLLGAAAAAALLLVVVPGLDQRLGDSGADQSAGATSTEGEAADGLPPEMQQPSPIVRNEALLEGPVVVQSSGCVRVLLPTDDLVPVILPPGYAVVRTGTEHHLVRPDGARVAAVGTGEGSAESLRFGGAYVDDVPIECSGTPHVQAFRADSVEAPAP